MIVLSPQVAEFVPAIAGLLVAAGGWALALYTRHQARPRD
jgi:hypothetical protein